MQSYTLEEVIHKLNQVTQQMMLKKRDNETIEADNVKTIESLQRRIVNFQNQITMERKQHQRIMKREKLIRIFLEDRIRRLDDKIESNDGLKHLQRLVDNNYI